MPDQLPSEHARLQAALDAMRITPDPSRDQVALVAARAVLASAPAARATTWVKRAAAVLTIATLGALLQRGAATPTNGVAGAPLDELPPTVTVSPVLATRARPIIFELHAPTARSVQVLGDFNGWARNASRMQRGTDGEWRLTTMLPPGRYVYAFLLDGRRFVPDPTRDRIEDRDFGVTGSELVVGEAP